MAHTWHDDERCDHPSQIGPVGSFGSAELPMWCDVDIYDWAKPSRSPIFDMFVSHFVGLHCRAGLQRHDRPTVVRRYCHQTRLGNRCNRWSLRALQRATMCSFLLNLAQYAVLSIHFHGRCGVSESFVHQRSPRPQRRPRAANRQANGGGERDHDVGRASSEFGK